MQIFTQPFLLNFQWIALSFLLLLMWQQFNQVKKQLLFFYMMGLLLALYFVGISQSVLILTVCLCMWAVAYLKMQYYAFLLFGLLVLLFAMFSSEWVPVLLVVIAAVLLFIKSWSWFDQKIDWRAIIKLILVIFMGSALIFGQVNIWYLVPCSGYIFIEVFFAQQRVLSLIDAESRWLDMIESSKEAERQRIYRNIHDVVGADLLQLVYQLDGHESQNQAKSVMQKIRQSVAVTSKYVIIFDDLFEDLCAEAKMRLALASIDFKYQASITDKNNLPVEVPVALTRIMRELITNVICHASASSVTLDATWAPENKTIVVKDNGVGIKGFNSSGKGLKSIQDRAQKIQADVCWNKINDAGTEVKLTMRLHD